MGLPTEDYPPGADNRNTASESDSARSRQLIAQGSGQLPYRHANSEEQQLAEGTDRTVRANQTSDGQRPRDRSKGRRKGSGQQRVCGKCGQQLTGQFVRALGDTYHLDCFTCYVSIRACCQRLEFS